MKKHLPFFERIGKLKNIKRQGILYYGFKNADSTTDHVFRLAMMVWVFGIGKKLDLGKAMTLALVHDLCKVYTGDITPYEGLISKKNKTGYRLAWRWRRSSLTEKKKRYKEKFQREQKALRKLTSMLPSEVGKEIMDVWLDYQKIGSPEAQFVSQLDRLENLLEALECKEQNMKFPTLAWWEHTDEVVHDEELLDFMEEISKKELKISSTSPRKRA